MEAVEEPPLQHAITEPAKNIEVTCEESAETDISVQSEVCHKPNGVAGADTEPAPASDEPEIPSEPPTNAVVEETHSEISHEVQEPVTAEEVVVEETPLTVVEEGTKEEVIEEEIVKTDGEFIQEHEIQIQGVEIDGIVETMPENVRFETEILIETNVDEQNTSTSYKIIYEDEEQTHHTNNILNDIGQNIELSDVLRSSDITENVENNNCEVAQEVFNKEELLDILEGNDNDEPKTGASDTFVADCKKLETQLALQQLSRLKQTRKVRTKKIVKIESPKEETPKKKSIRHKEENTPTNNSSPAEIKVESTRKRSSRQKEDVVQVSKEGTEDVGKRRGNKQKDESSQSGGEGANEAKEENAKKKKIKLKKDTQSSGEPAESNTNENIVSALVQDWDDDEPAEEVPEKVIENSEQVLGESEELVKKQEAAVHGIQVSNADTSVPEESTPEPNKNDSESQPQRRLSRVIKKKVIFDPDNPDTFTKTKVTIKKENQPEKDQKEQPTPKKIKTDVTPRSQSKSPIQSKLQWKKPQPKNLKTNRRLTEIDRLLMDEGAVNMICQLTPEAPQGNKTTKSKAEFIKKIQRSTPEGKEMKFRERKKEMKADEGDPKKIGSGKHRLSLNNSVKSPAVSEDFEAHCADDSIIYRRHSSSSYSSPCMSPRRMSDVEGVTLTAATTPQQATPNAQLIIAKEEIGTETPSDVFMVNEAQSPSTPVINKNNLMSMKEKLNSKLSLALNKRKRESTKPEKPTKVKRVSRSSEKAQASGEYKYLKITNEQGLAEICMQSTGALFNVEVMKELCTALEAADKNKEVSVTLLTSDSGSLCSGLELDSVLDPENGANHAIELADSVRSLLSTLEHHSKLVCSVVEERCHGLALALVALSDVSVAGETATFQLTSEGALQPGAAALITRGLTQSLVNELVVLERAVSASDAVSGGLVTRAVWPARAPRTSLALAAHILAQAQGGGSEAWPERVQEQARNIARDLAAQPALNTLLKKQLLRLQRAPSASFQAALQAEKEHFATYWSSPEGRELIRATHTAKE